MPVTELIEIDSVTSKGMRVKNLSLSPQTAKDTLILTRMIWRKEKL